MASDLTYKEFNDFCRALQATSYVVQWGGAHVWKVVDKVFAIGGWEKIDRPAFTFKVSNHNFLVLSEQPGFRPAPYMASRGMKWIQQYDAQDDTVEQLQYYLTESHRLVASGLTKKKQKEFGLDAKANR